MGVYIEDLRPTGQDLSYVYVAAQIGVIVNTFAIGRLSFRSVEEKQTAFSRYIWLTVISSLAVCMILPMSALFSMWNIVSSDVVFHIWILKWLEIYSGGLNATMASVLMVLLWSTNNLARFQRFQRIFSRIYVTLALLIPAMVPATTALLLSTKISVLNSYIFIGRDDDSMTHIIDLFQFPKVLFGIPGAVFWLKFHQERRNMSVFCMKPSNQSPPPAAVFSSTSAEQVISVLVARSNLKNPQRKQSPRRSKLEKSTKKTNSKT